MQDKDLVNEVLLQIKVLKQFMSSDIQELESLLKEIGEPMTDARMAYIRNRINELCDSLTMIYATFSILAVPNAYKAGQRFAADVLGIQRLMATKISDEKAINQLIRDMNHDFRSALANGQDTINFVMKQFSKQGRLTESEISLYVAKGYIDTNTAMGAKKLLRQEIGLNNQGILDESALGRSIKRRLKKAEKEINAMNINEGLKEHLLKERIAKINDGKFMQIINKNGDIMTFRVDTYADLVSRTRLGDAQVAGTIEEASKYNIDTFRISDHNTATPKCQEFEGKIYTTEIKNRKFPLLTDSTRPLYHVNCQHRILPYTITSSKLATMENVR